jgi:hypothetical protein
MSTTPFNFVTSNWNSASGIYTNGNTQYLVYGTIDTTKLTQSQACASCSTATWSTTGSVVTTCVGKPSCNAYTSLQSYQCLDQYGNVTNTCIDPYDNTAKSTRYVATACGSMQCVVPSFVAGTWPTCTACGTNITRTNNYSLTPMAAASTGPVGSAGSTSLTTSGASMQRQSQKKGWFW